MDIIDQIDIATGCQHCGGTLGDSPSAEFCTPKCQGRWHAARTDPLVGYVEPTDIPAHVSNQRELQSPETTPGRLGSLIEAHLQIDLTHWQRAMLQAMNTARQPPAVLSSGDAVVLAIDPAVDPSDHRQPSIAVGRLVGGVMHVQLLDDDGREQQLAVLSDSLMHTMATARAAMAGLTEHAQRALANLGPVLRQLFPEQGPPRFGAELRISHLYQAAIDARRTRHTGPAQSARAPRRIDPRRTR